MKESTYRPVGFGGAVVRQFRLLWTSRRPLILGVALLAILVLAGEPWSDDPKARLFTYWPLWLVLTGPIWAFVVYHNEGPSNRLYHWSLPTDRLLHTAARLTAGLAWLWILFLLLIGAGAVMAAMDGDLWQFAEIDAAGWINLFTGPLLGYLGVSIITVASDYPLRWFFGLLFLFPLTMSILDEWLEMDEAVETLLKPLAADDWGFFPVMIGGFGSAANQLDHLLRAMENPDYSYAGEVMVDHWWMATPLWILLIGLVVALLASRHPDTLPRLRRSG